MKEELQMRQLDKYLITDNAEILTGKKQEYDAIQGPRVGDYLLTNDGEYLRFTYDWGTTIQTTCKDFSSSESFYLDWDGHVEYSGALDSGIPKKALVLTQNTKLAAFWFFSNGRAMAHNGYRFSIPVRVYCLS